MSNKQISQALSSFEAIYCSGFFVPDPALITAMGLLFERVHFVNHVEYIVHFARNFEFSLTEEQKRELLDVQLNPAPGLTFDEADPFRELDDDEKITAYAYLEKARLFLYDYSELFPTVFQSSYLPSGKIIDIKLMDKKPQKGKYLWGFRWNPMFLSLGQTQEIEEHIQKGAIPIVASHDMNRPQIRMRRKLSGIDVASILAMQAVEMMLPATRRASDYQIMEARQYLVDQLPPFWSAMLKLSRDVKTRLQHCKSTKETIDECKDVVDTTVRPAVIELNEKLNKDRRTLFSSVLAPIKQRMNLSITAGLPVLALTDLTSASMLIAANANFDLSENTGSRDLPFDQSALIYLIRLNMVMTGDKRK
jgi:hypothetical protein